MVVGDGGGVEARILERMVGKRVGCWRWWLRRGLIVGGSVGGEIDCWRELWRRGQVVRESGGGEVVLLERVVEERLYSWRGWWRRV